MFSKPHFFSLEYVLCRKVRRPTVPMFTCTKYSVFCPYSEKDNIPTKFMKIPLIVFAYSCVNSK